MIRTLAATAVLGIALTGCATQGGITEAVPDTSTTAPAASPSQGADTAGGARATKDPANDAGMDSASGGYISQADYEKEPAAFSDSDVVLFFNATWCPTCQEADENLSSAQFPDGLTVVSVDYDSNEALRDRYGVTTQHTFVVIGPDGSVVKKFTGASDVAEIQGNLA